MLVPKQLVRLWPPAVPQSRELRGPEGITGVIRIGPRRPAALPVFEVIRKGRYRWRIKLLDHEKAERIGRDREEKRVLRRSGHDLGVAIPDGQFTGRVADASVSLRTL